jgi:FixJ family two-component response regulator
METASRQLASTPLLPTRSRSHSDFSTMRCSMEKTGEVAYLVSDCSMLREAVSRAFEDTGLVGVVFGSPREYLEYNRIDECSCLILDLHFRDQDGLDLQCRLAKEALPPVVFISGHGDIASAVRAMKAGAVEVLTKPVNQGALNEAIRAAFAQDRKLRQKKAELSALRQRYSLLTPRQREVFRLVVGGLLNKQAASVLGIAQVTLQVHRGQIMRQMQASSFAELVRMAEKLGISLSNDTQFHWNLQKDRRIPERQTSQDIL